MRTSEQVIADVRKNLCALCEDTEEKYAAVAQSDTEGKQGSFARGRITEAKGIRNAMCEYLRTLRDDETKAGEGLVINKAVTREDIAKVIDPGAFKDDVPGEGWSRERYNAKLADRRMIAFDRADAILALISAGGGK